MGIRMIIRLFDKERYSNIVVRTRGLFPISNLMLHGVICGKVGTSPALGLDICSNSENDDFREEVWSFFATGTSLQELCILKCTYLISFRYCHKRHRQSQSLPTSGVA